MNDTENGSGLDLDSMLGFASPPPSDGLDALTDEDMAEAMSAAPQRFRTVAEAQAAMQQQAPLYPQQAPAAYATQQTMHSQPSQAGLASVLKLMSDSSVSRGTLLDIFSSAIRMMILEVPGLDELLGETSRQLAATFEEDHGMTRGEAVDSATKVVGMAMQKVAQKVVGVNIGESSPVGAERRVNLVLGAVKRLQERKGPLPSASQIADSLGRRNWTIEEIEQILDGLVRALRVEVIAPMPGPGRKVFRYKIAGS